MYPRVAVLDRFLFNLYTSGYLGYFVKLHGLSIADNFQLYLVHKPVTTKKPFPLFNFVHNDLLFNISKCIVLTVALSECEARRRGLEYVSSGEDSLGLAGWQLRHQRSSACVKEVKRALQIWVFNAVRQISVDAFSFIRGEQKYRRERCTLIPASTRHVSQLQLPTAELNSTVTLNQPFPP
ncbi:hypothetical protein J6590_064976 [Homalodisca vitripennis]|nr:hypothetical protein J6590_064976 [Homalodisca vitripennis]